MAEKTEVVLDLSVDQGSMITELERTKKSIVQLKEEQQKLTKAYKDGQVTVDEYASESVRLEAILKKEQATYNNTQKAVTGVKTSMDKLTESIKAQSSNIKINGVSVADLTSKVTSLLNPVTAAAAAVTGLSALYLKSAAGAEDFARAQNNLNALVDQFANRVGGSGGDQIGIAQAFSEIVSKVAIAFTSNTKEIQKQRNAQLERAQFALQTLRSLEEEQITASQIRKETEKEAENQRRIRDDQDKSQKERLEAANTVTKELNKNEDARVGIINKQIRALLTYGEAVGSTEKGVLNQFLHHEGINFELIKDRDQRILIRKLAAEAADIEEEINGKLTENIKAQEAITKELGKQGNLRNAIRFKAGSADSGEQFFDDQIGLGKVKEFDPQEQFEKDAELINAELGLVVTSEEAKQTAALQTNAVKQMIHEEDLARMQESLQMTKDNFNNLALLFSEGTEARKIFSLLSIGADTAQAIASLTAASEANPANAFTFGGAGIAQYAAGIIRILSNIVAAKSFLGGNFAGGADFVTSKPTMIMVGDNPGGRERVTVQPLSGRGKSNFNPRAGFANFAGGGSMTFDGASASANATVTQALIQSNAIKNMPRPVVGVKQFVEVWNEVQVKQDVSRA